MYDENNFFFLVQWSWDGRSGSCFKISTTASNAIWAVYSEFREYGDTPPPLMAFTATLSR